MANQKDHDSLGQNVDESEVAALETEFGADTLPVEAAEESAMHSDNETAQELNQDAVVADEALEAEALLVEEAIEKKHKNRESTSEKSKRAAIERAAKTGSAEPVATKQLDPLRLRGKNYRAKVVLVDKETTYSPVDAIALAKETSYAKFDAALELHCKVKTDNVRGMVTLPHGTGKTRKVAVADDATIEAISNGNLDFDVLLATPSQMPKLAKFAKILGPKGLMPSPKAGTVTEDIEKTREEIGGGRVEYRADKSGVIHMSIGRVSFSNEQLLENYEAIQHLLSSQKIQSISLSTTMGPGIKVKLS
jgi:large subunit ribosomal protein L1